MSTGFMSRMSGRGCWPVYSMAALLCVTLLAAAGPSPDHPPTFHYDDDRFGFGVDIPAGFVAEEPPDNDDGRTFHAPDGTMEIKVWAVGNVADDTMASYLQYYVADCLRHPPEYLDQHAAWAVLSCTTGAGVKYLKVAMRGQGEDAVFTTVELVYPAAARQRWDTVAAATARSLRPAVPQ